MTPADRAPRAPATARREFLGQLATATVALAGTACVGARATAAAEPAPVRPKPPAPTDAWTSRITGAHKVVFDSKEIGDGVVIGNALVYMKDYEDMYQVAERDISAVVVIRHAAIPMVVDDEFWAKYDVGRLFKVNDPASGRRAARNVFWKAAAGDAEGAAFTLDALRTRGAILLGCSRAASRMASEIAGKTKQQAPDVMAELRAHLIPGLELAPSGIFAVTRAQEAGCAYVRSA